MEAAGDSAVLQQSNIDSVVSLTHRDPESGFPDAVAVSQYPMMDGPRNEREPFQEAVKQILSDLKRGKTVLVHCNRGASRSPSVAAAAVALQEGIGIEESFEQIGNRREGFDPHNALVRQAVTVYRDLNAES